MSKCDLCGGRLPRYAEGWCPLCGAPVPPDSGPWELGAAAPCRADGATGPTPDVEAAPPPAWAVRSGRRRRWRPLWVIVALALLAGMGMGTHLLAQSPARDEAGADTSGLSIYVESSASGNLQTTVSEDPRSVSAPATASGGTRRFLAYDAASGKYGYANEMGAWIIAPRFEAAGQFVGGLAPVQVKDQSGSAGYGYIDTTGALVIEPRFRTASAFSEGLARVEMTVNGLSRYGFIDRSGAMIIEPLYAAAWDFSQGLARIGLSDASGPLRYGFIDRTGAVVISPQFESARDFTEGLAAVAVTRDGVQKWGYIDRTGAWVIEPRFYYALSFLPSGLAAVELEHTGIAATDPSGVDPSYLDLHLTFIDKAGRVVSEGQQHQGG